MSQDPRSALPPPIAWLARTYDEARDEWTTDAYTPEMYAERKDNPKYCDWKPLYGTPREAVTAALPPVLPAKCMRCGAPSPLTDCMDVACPHPTAPQEAAPALDDARDEQAWIDAVRTAEHLCPTDRPHLDRLRWKALHIRAAMQQEPRS